MSFRLMSNSRSATEKMCVFGMSEPVYAHYGGIYLGRTSVYRIPFLLDLTKTVNPHIAIAGMSGSGKSYMLKNLIVRLAVYDSPNILVIDWNGEYSGVMEFIGGNEYVASNTFAGNTEAEEGHRDAGVICSYSGKEVRFLQLLQGISSLNLCALRDDQQRKSLVYLVMHMLIEHMHGRGIVGNMRLVVILDEAWRALDNQSIVQQLYREGRKYGLSIVTATQSVSDISKGVISNSACLFMFRLQGDGDLRWLVDNGVLEQGEAVSIGELPVGSCLAHITYRDAGHPQSFFLDKIDGFSTDLYKVDTGDEMEYKISANMLDEVGNRLGLDNRTKNRIRNMIERGGSRTDLVGLIREMIGAGLDRPTIIAYIRMLNIPDIETVEAYENSKDVRLETE